MSASVNMPAYADALVVLGTAGIVVPLVHRWGLSPVLGYLGVGALLGPLGLGAFAGKLPLLQWITITDTQSVTGIADLGVVFLLFLIGLELPYERLRAIRRLVFGLGGLQVIITSTLLSVIIAATGQKPQIAMLLGACLALSSTAIVLEVISSQRRMATSVGRTSFAVLLAQDLAVIPILTFVSVVGGDKAGGSVLASVALALTQAGAAVAVIVVVGRRLLRPLFRHVARTQSSELFMAAILFVIVATGVVAALANMSMALGAFVAGLMLAETEYRKAIEATIEPFKGLLLGVFFFTVGMGLDVGVLLSQPWLLLASALGLIVIKAGVLAGLVRLFKLPLPVAIETGLLLGPSGEFAFVGIGLAATLGVVPQSVASFTLALTSLTMALIPLLAIAAKRLAAVLAKPRVLDAALAIAPEPQTRHAIIVGHGRVGKVVCTMLKRHGIKYTAVDHDAIAVSEDRALGHAVYYGNAADEKFLQQCGLMEAAGVIVTIHTRSAIDQVVRHACPLTRSVSSTPGTRNSNPMPEPLTMLPIESSRLLPARSGMARRLSSSTTTNPAGPPFGDTSPLPSVDVVPMRTNGEASMNARAC